MNITSKSFNALLQASNSVTLDGSGNGVAVCGPTGLGNVWVPIQVAVSTSTNVSTPIANLYLGPLLPPMSLKVLLKTSQVTNLGGTATANNDSIGFVSNLTVPQGQALIVQWAGGDAGATATMVVTGTQIATYFR